MLKKIVVFAVIAMVFVSCKKASTSCPYTDSNVVAPASEVATLQTWVNGSYPAAVQHSSGFYYEIVNPGTGANATLCSNVTVNYSLYLSNGTQVPQGSGPVTFDLGGLIIGWQKGIPLVKAGGSINLYLPPSLAYGSQANGPIPANSYLRFVIQVVSVQN